VSQQLGHSKPTTTLKHYAKWMPSGNRRYVDVLDREFEKVWHQKLAPTAEMKADLDRPKSEVYEKVKEEIGGPCRGRTCGPLIKSEYVRMAQSSINWVIPTTVVEIHAQDIRRSSFLLTSHHPFSRFI